MIATSHRGVPDRSSRIAFVMALTAFAVVYLANSWVGDDAYISFRVSDNLIHGYGPRWNVAERVQAFTNPLWMFLMAAAGAVSGEFLYTSMVVSFGFCVALVTVVWRWLSRSGDRWLALGLILSSKAFIDYSSSGLEYPLSYLLLALFVIGFSAGGLEPPSPAAVDTASLAPIRPDRLRMLVFIASLAFVNRADTILLYLPAIAYLLVHRLRRGEWRSLLGLVVPATPAWAWLLFSIVYFGFPFPNTYYAKVGFGAPHWVQISQGLAYVVSSLRFDPITLSTIVAATGVAWAVRGARARALSIGACTYVGYTIWVGGDFMAGRFFALPFLTSALLLASLPKTRRAATVSVGLLIVLNVVNPIAPFKTIPFSDIGWPWRLQNGVKDERGATFKSDNPLFHEVFRRIPDNAVTREGHSFYASPEKVLVHPWIGAVGYFAGPAKYIIDPNGLSDPLLARLPVGQEFYFAFWVSHWTRALPAGYLESRRAGRNLIEDPAIHAYYDKILNITTGPIFSLSRFRDIVELNWGRLRNFHTSVKATQRLNYTARMNNPLFASDAGELDGRSETMRATGKAGYLLFGPNLPLAPGIYDVRWNGSTPRDGATVGFVEVCYNDCHTVLSRTSITARADGVLAEAPARFGDDVRDVEFRMYVYENSQVTLQSVTITQR